MKLSNVRRGLSMRPIANLWHLQEPTIVGRPLGGASVFRCIVVIICVFRIRVPSIPQRFLKFDTVVYPGTSVVLSYS